MGDWDKQMGPGKAQGFGYYFEYKCRCGTDFRIREAIKAGAARMS